MSNTTSIEPKVSESGLSSIVSTKRPSVTAMFYCDTILINGECAHPAHPAQQMSSVFFVSCTYVVHGTKLNE